MSAHANAPGVCRFYLNGKLTTVQDADPLAPLVNTIRERCHAKATKVGCSQGNCGACTVTISWPEGDPRHTAAPMAVNACLFPTGGLFVDPHGDPATQCASITTVEGAIKNKRMASAARSIAECNGTQCGFCTAGMVMKAAYYEGEVQSGLTNCTVRDVEDLLEGNLCRCTGFRPILYAMKKHFIGEQDPKVAEEMISTPALVTQGDANSYLKCYATGDYSSPNVFVPATANDGDSRRRVIPRDESQGNAFLLQNDGKKIVKRPFDMETLQGPNDSTSSHPLINFRGSQQRFDDGASLPTDSPALPLSPANASYSARVRSPVEGMVPLTPPALPMSRVSLTDLYIPSPQLGVSGNAPPAAAMADGSVNFLPGPKVPMRLTKNSLQPSSTRHSDPAVDAAAAAAPWGTSQTQQPPTYRRPRALSLVSDAAPASYTPAAGEDIFRSMRSPTANHLNATHTSAVGTLGPRDGLDGDADTNSDSGSTLQLSFAPRTGPNLNAPTGRGGQWFAPTKLSALIEIMSKLQASGQPYQLVAGNCSSAWSRLYEEAPNANFISVVNLTEIHQRITRIENGARTRVYAANTLNEWVLYLKHTANRGVRHGVVHDETLDLVTQHSFSTANIQVRSLGTIAGNIIYANTRKGILHSDISVMFAALDAQMCYTTTGEDEHYISVAEFQRTVEPIKGVWVCKHFDLVTPTSQFVTLRIARTGDRNENFPTSCSAVFSALAGSTTAKMFFTGPHRLEDGSFMHPAPVLLEVHATLSASDPIGNLRKVDEATRTDPIMSQLATSEKQLLVQMSARVLTVDNNASGTQMTSMLEERKIEGQTKNAQYFYVDPLESPLTEPIVKQDAYLAVNGKAVYPFDVVDANMVNGAPVLSPVPVLTFDPYDLERRGRAFVQNIDAAADFFTAASMPYDPEIDKDVAAYVPMPWVKPDVPGDEKRMFTGRNVLYGELGYGGNYQYGVEETLKPHRGKSATNKYGPGGFGEFAIAPGFTVYAGQIIAFVVHPDETKGRGLAALVMQEIDALLANAGTGRLNVILADRTAELGILDIQSSRAMGKAIVGPEVQSPSVFGRGLATFNDDQGKQEYEAWWEAQRADPTNVYVELMPGDFVSDADGWAAALEKSKKDAEARAAATKTPVQAHGPVVAASQVHFYMETQTCLVSASDEGRYRVIASAQGPGDIQSSMTRILNVPVRDITIVNNRIGGAFGGKSICAMTTAVCCGFLAMLTGRPTRLCFERRIDMQVVGKRHMEEGRYRAVVRADPRQPDFGKILGLDLWYDGDAGSGTFVSPTILQFSGLIGESMYNVPNFRIEGNVFLTHKQSSTAMRAFGGIQATTITESAIDHAYSALAERLSAELDGAVISPEEFRFINFYRKQGDIVPHTLWRSWVSWAPGNQAHFVHYHQPLLETDIMTGDGKNPGVWRTTIESPEYLEALTDVREFNRTNLYRKRGIAVIPIKYAGGWDPKDKFYGRAARFMVQNNVLVNIYTGGGNYPGYVLVNQAGVEMGQGVHVMVQQMAAATLDVPCGIVRIAPMNTDTVPNQICTGASNGGDINMHGVREACTELRHRLELMMDQILYADIGKRLDNPAKYGLKEAQIAALETLLTEYDPVHGFAAVGTASNPSLGWLTLQKSAMLFPIVFTGIMPPKPRSPSSGRTTPTSPATPDPANDPSLYYQAPLGSYHANYYLASFRSWKVPEPIKGRYDRWSMDYSITREMYLDDDYLIKYGPLLEQWDPMCGFANVVDLDAHPSWMEAIAWMTKQRASNPRYYDDLIFYANKTVDRHLVDPAHPPSSLTLSVATKYWVSIVGEAFCNRVLLTAVGQGNLNADGEADIDAQNWFCYFIYGAAWSVVEVDGVTGQTDVIRSDIYYDAGNSPNPAADIGQVEGAFVHGLGNVLTEQCDWNPKTGVLNQRSIMDVALPDQRMIPRSLNTHLFWLDGASASDNANGDGANDVQIDIKRRMQTPVFKSHRSKAASEASMCMSVVLMMAARNAIAEIRSQLFENVPAHAFVPLSTPLIPQRVLEAIYGPGGNVLQVVDRLQKQHADKMASEVQQD